MPLPKTCRLIACALIIAVLSIAVPMARARANVFSGTSATCGQIHGETADDLGRVKRFCAAMVPQDLGVQGAIAMSSLLWIKVNRATAIELMRDSLSAEQVVKLWMQKWKAESGSQAVTVTVEFGDVQIAEGQTSVFRGDQVTVRRP